MNTNTRFRTVPVFAVASLCLCAAGCAYRWQAESIGGADGEGSFTTTKRSLTISGDGTGINRSGGDQCRFVSIPWTRGDFEIVVRVTQVDGGEKASAGLMARAGNDSEAFMTAAQYHAEKPSAGWKTRVPGEGVGDGPRFLHGGIRLADGPPLWLKLVRIGNSFGAYKSGDGRFWSMLSNVSGGPVSLDGDFQVGLFVAGGAEGETATAVFDNIRIGKPKLRYRTSWVGNTYGSRDEDGHVSNTLSAMWVAPDGTVFASSYFDEGGQPVVAYRNGKPIQALGGTTYANEGGITGDGDSVYFASGSQVLQVNRVQLEERARPLELITDMRSKGDRYAPSRVSGLASTGKELFIADFVDQVIRVASLKRPAQRWRPIAANPRVQLSPEPVKVTGDDPRFAPVAVYQTQRGGEGIQYVFPGMTPGETFTGRLHLAEFEDRSKLAPDDRARFLSVQGDRVNVAESAGGIRTAFVHDVERKADKEGKLTIGYGSYGPGVCGIEVLDAKGKRLYAINCGGQTVDSFEGESQELPDRAFAFERPGPMTVDQRGDLWIIQCGRDYPLGGIPIGEHPAAIKCYRPDGTFTGRQITDVVNPRGLGYDAENDRLLVAENGPDLNVRIYGDLAPPEQRPVDTTGPSLVQTFGAKGGIYAGEHPGRAYDPDAGGHARFQGVAGVGMDAQSNLYVGGGFQGTDLRKFTQEGDLEWQINSLIFCNTYDVDPDSGGTDIYATYNHLKLDLSNIAPGSEQTFAGFNWDLRRFGAPERVSNSQAIVRRLGPDRDLFLFTTGQGQIHDINIFRQEGDLWIPSGKVLNHGRGLWIDANGNGMQDAGETGPLQGRLSWISGVDVDDRGDIRVAVGAPHGGCYIGHLVFLGLNEQGVPLYRGKEGDGLTVTKLPEEGGTVSAWGMTCRLAYDRERDLMVLLYPAKPRAGERDKNPPRYYLAAYPRWSEGNREPLWKQIAPTPGTHPRWFMYEQEPGPYNLFTGFMGMQIAGDYLFAAELWGQVYAFDLETGELAELFAVGPEMDGRSAWEDAAMGLRAFKRKNGEYLIFTENSGWGGKNNFWRWTPE